MPLRCEDELSAPVQSPGGRLDLNAGRGGGLGAVNGKPDVAGGDAIAQHVVYAWVGCCDFFEVVGRTGHGGGSGWDLASRKGSFFYLSAGDIHIGCERVCFCTTCCDGRYASYDHTICGC